MTHWQEIIRKLIAPQHRVRIGVVGKYIGLQDAYKSVYEAIIHGGIANDCGVEIVKVDAEEIERERRGQDAQGPGRHPGAGRIRRARHRGQNPGGPIRPREPHPLPGPVPGHADRHHRIRAQCAETAQGALDRI